jgi:RNA polymerase-binding transcription factor DksA
VDHLEVLLNRVEEDSDTVRTLQRVQELFGPDVVPSIDEGTFGIRRSCGDALPDARLEAKPDANLCIECASKRER